MRLPRPRPPVIAEVRRPHLSARRKAGIEIASIRMAETPEARNEAVEDESPACEKRTGAYYHLVSIVLQSRMRCTHV